MPKVRLWKCPLKTKAKLEILQHYLGAWFSILAVKGFQHVYYIDGFCGPGEYLDGEEGSPVIAARMASAVAQKFPGFKATLILIDDKAGVIEHLRTLSAIKKPHPNVIIDIKEGEFADQVDAIVDELGKNPSSPTFGFIDPFGFGQSPFDTIKLLMHNERSELFINFMCGFMNRFKSHPDEAVVDKVRNMVGQRDLAPIIEADDSIDAFCSAFETNLKTVGRYTLKFMMRDENNIRDNAFFFCGRQSRGFEKIKAAMWKVDPIHGNSFSAHRENQKDNIQSDMFGQTADTHQLAKLILGHFQNRRDVPVSEIFKWVVEETDTYIKAHARKELEHLFARGSITNVTDPSGATRKRPKNAWPERLLLSFGSAK